MERPILLFDVMGTLVTEPFLEAMPAFFEMSLSELRSEVHPTAWIEFEKGRMGEEQFCEQFFKDGRAVSLEGLRTCLFDAYEWIEGMEDLLAELSSLGYSMHALSNYPIWFEMIEQKLGLSRFVEWSFVSCKTGHRKPDVEAYRVVESTLQVAPQNCLFVDDRTENVQAALDVGMDSFLIEDAQGVREQFVRRAMLTSGTG